MDIPQSNIPTPVCSYARTELLSLRTNISLLSLSTADLLKELNIGYHLSRRQRSCRGVKRAPNGSSLFAAGSSTDTVDSQNSTLHVKSPFWWRSRRYRHYCSDFCLNVPAISKRSLDRTRHLHQLTVYD